MYLALFLLLSSYFHFRTCMSVAFTLQIIFGLGLYLMFYLVFVLLYLLSLLSLLILNNLLSQKT